MSADSKIATLASGTKPGNNRHGLILMFCAMAVLAAVGEILVILALDAA